MCGANISRFAELSGLKGIVADGCVRDISALGRRTYPIFARGVAVTSYASEMIMLDVGCDIECGGVPVANCDIVVGDEDGVVCLPAPRLFDIMHEAEEIFELDQKLGTDIERRLPLIELHKSRARWSVRRTLHP
ncbi:RraA family protein [Bosea sp. NPDC055332]